MKTILTFITLTSLIFISCAESGEKMSEIDGRGYSDSSRLVSTEWVESEINNEKIIIIDVRKKEEYDKGHIPGAFHMTPGEVFQQEINGVKGMLPSPSHIEKNLSLIGVKPDSTIVLYDGNSNLWASRGLWALQVYGHENTKLLDGVWGKWEKEGREVSTSIPKANISNYKFETSLDGSIIAGFDEILESIEDPTKIVCDTRSPEEYTGKDVRADRGGHIPNSKNVNWVMGVNEEGEFKSASELKELYEGAGITDGETIYTLCQTAVRATHTWFIL
ncbi:MAG: sulfurtransferase, partial [Dehalococcoidia bacterium]